MLEKNYNPKDFEEKIYADWENSGDFKPDMSKNKEAFAVVIPPPNVTGVLHMGHALDDTLQDILIRYNRMLGKKVLWQPGMDHAGIATQMVVERNLAKEGITRHDLGREKFVETVWKWKEQAKELPCCCVPFAMSRWWITSVVLHVRADTGLTVRARAIYIYCARPRAATPWAIPSRRPAAVVTF